jgi:hypothetical protein
MDFDQNDPELVKLAANSGASLVGANDANSGSLYTTVQGFITYVKNLGAKITGWLPLGTGGVTTTVDAALQNVVSFVGRGVVGDGVTHDDAAIQAVFNYAASIGSAVYMKGGTVGNKFATNAPIIAQTSYFGDGLATTISPLGNFECFQLIMGVGQFARDYCVSYPSSSGIGTGQIAHWFNKGTIASASQDIGTGIFTTVGQRMFVNQPVQIEGTPPTGFSLLTTYYVIASGLTSTTCKLSATLGGAAIVSSVSSACTIRAYLGAATVGTNHFRMSGVYVANAWNALYQAGTDHGNWWTSSVRDCLFWNCADYGVNFDFGKDSGSLGMVLDNVTVDGIGGNYATTGKGMKINSMTNLKLNGIADQDIGSQGGVLALSNIFNADIFLQFEHCLINAPCLGLITIANCAGIELSLDAVTQTISCPNTTDVVNWIYCDANTSGITIRRLMETALTVTKGTKNKLYYSNGGSYATNPRLRIQDDSFYSTDMAALTPQAVINWTKFRDLDFTLEYNHSTSRLSGAINVSVATAYASASQDTGTGQFVTATQAFVAGTPVTITGTPPTGLAVSTAYYVLGANSVSVLTGAGGSGYTNSTAQPVTFTGGTGTVAAVATCNVVGGVPGAITIVSSGTYSVAPTGATLPGGTGWTPTITAAALTTTSCVLSASAGGAAIIPSVSSACNVVLAYPLLTLTAYPGALGKPSGLFMVQGGNTVNSGLGFTDMVMVTASRGLQGVVVVSSNIVGTPVDARTYAILANNVLQCTVAGNTYNTRTTGIDMRGATN